MHQAAQFQFGRILLEYADWQAIPSQQRSPAPAWWWSPALILLHEPAALPADWSDTMSLLAGSSYGAAAQIILDALADQTGLPWPDEFPRKLEEADAA
jgi:hypothetical protein